ncbi:MAG TPA: DUF1844 domain-containing protein [Terracidiphilus sp.]|nr:DUF1844 domain-containing protein [Terracidiphilus sp.]
MTDTPKFEVIDRRKMKAEEEQGASQSEASAPATPAEEPAASGGPRLVVNDASRDSAAAETAPEATAAELEAEMPAPPTAEESSKQKAAYDASSQRLEDLMRAQNPAVGPTPPVTFDALVQQFYISAMIQMGAGTQEGQRPRVDILGARTTIDLLAVLAEKTKGNLTESEDRMLQSVLFDVRMAFLELTSMINLQAMQPPAPPPPGKK